VTVGRVFNASPIIALAKAGLQDVLMTGVDEVWVPAAVAAEVEAGPDDDPARLLLSAGFGVRLPPCPIPASVLEWGLGEGESAVIAEAIARTSEAVLDDAASRRCARIHGVPVVGTLGIVCRARQAGMIPSAARAFADLREAGLFFRDDLATAILSALGESWPGRAVR
jgi:predicted nucleic acid-binding protein